MSNNDEAWMRRALQLARRGEGAVEPNPMVGCVLVKDDECIGQGWHKRFGGPHAEIEALKNAKSDVSGCTAYVTLEPCCHFGKTGPCSQALISAGVDRVVVGCLDPFPQVDGGGVRQLQEAGVSVATGVLEREARAVIAPFATRLLQQRPWLIAKWAMTLDGRIATSTGSSKWISNELSRRVVHEIRGRVDAIMVGIGTVLADDPQLTARPAGLRTPLRVILDSRAQLPPLGKIAGTAREFPTLLLVGPDANVDQVASIEERGVIVASLSGTDHATRLREALQMLATQQITNVLVEGGGQLLGSLRDLDMIDEYHIFIAPKLVGGARSPGPLGGDGVREMSESVNLADLQMERLRNDLYIRGRRPSTY